MKTTVYAGTYSENGSEGLYAFDFADGVLSPARVFHPLKNTKYLTVTDRGIVTLCDWEDRSGAALLDKQGNLLGRAAYEGCTSCFVAADGDTVYTANYHEGTVSRLTLGAAGLAYRDTIRIREKAGCHQVLRWGDRLLVPSLFLDQVRLFDLDMNPAGSIDFPAGTGPRHGVFSADGQRLYLVSELSNELFVISAGDWQILSHISILPGGETHRKDTAAIRLAADGRHLYVSTRTLDLLSVVELDGDTPRLVQAVPCGGQHPRDFILLGNWLLTADRFPGEAVSFALNGDGTIGEQTGRTAVPGVVCLAVRQ